MEKNKIIIVTTSLIALLQFLSSCCKTIECDTYSIKNFTVYQFTRQESDTFIIRRYKPATNFTEKIDTLLVARDKNAVYSDISNEPASGVNLNIDVKYEISAGYDYEFYFPATNTLRQITEFTDIKGEMKYCRPSLQKNSCMNQFGSLKIDGRLVTSNFPGISK